MPRPEKVQAVQDIRERLESAQAVFLTEYRGLSVKEVSELRRALRASGAEYKVVKMTLARRAADEAGVTGLEDYLVGPTALAFALRDPVATAKALKEFSKTNETLVLKAGYLSGQVLTPEEVTKLAEIEPREVLLAKFAGAAKAPLYAAAGMFAALTRNAASVFSQLLDKKESGEFVPGGAADEAPAPAVAAADAPAEEVAEEAAPEAEAAADEPAAEAEAAEEEPAEEQPEETTAAEAEEE